MTFFSAFVVGSIILSLAVIVACLITHKNEKARQRHWDENKRPCSHCGTDTLDVSQGAFPTLCPTGQPCCEDCTVRHEIEIEPVYHCPAHNIPMEKIRFGDGLIKDVCPTGSCLFLSEAELRAIRDAAYNRGHGDGRSSGQASGQAAGFLLGSIIN